MSSAPLAFDVFVNDPPPRNDGFLPNGDPKGGSPVASTLIYGGENAILTDPAFTSDQAQAIYNWVASKKRKVTDIFITHGHGDHWFAAQLLAERFGARVVATACTIAQMPTGIAARSLLWDKLYSGIPASRITAVTAPDNRLSVEGHELVMVEVGHSDTDDTSVLHVPDLALVVAGDVIYNGAHMYLAESAGRGFGAWRDAISKVESLGARHIIAGHQNKHLDDDATRTIAETRGYLDYADELLATRTTAVDFFNAMITRYPGHVARSVLWASTRALFGIRERPNLDARKIILESWL